MKRILLCVIAAALVASSLSGCMVLGGMGAVLGQMQAGEKQPAQNASAGDPEASSQSGTTSRVEDSAPNGTSPDNGKEELSPIQPAPEQNENEKHENNTNDDRNDQWTEDEDAGRLPEVELPSEKNELVAYDNTFSVEGFPGWYRESASLNAASQLTIGDGTKNFYMMFITERKSDFGGIFTPEEVVGFMADNIRNVDPEASVGRIRMTKVDGYIGATCTVEATVSGMNLTYQMTAVDRDDYFLEITSWSKNSMANQGQKYFLEIMESYKER